MDPPEKTVLILSGTIPGEPGVGGVILKDIADSRFRSSLACATVPSKQAVAAGWMAHCPFQTPPFVRQFESGWRPFRGIAGELMGYCVRSLAFRRHCRKLVRQITDSFSKKEIRRVWAVLDCPTVIEIAEQVGRRLNVALSVMVWDAPELLVSQLHLDRWSGRSLLRRFDNVIRSADRVGVICEQMQHAYASRFGNRSFVIMRHGTDEELWQNLPEKQGSSRFYIGFAGSITAQQPFQQLIRMLDACQWVIRNKAVTLRLIGSRYTLDSRSPQSIEYFGWRSPEETVKLLASCDCLYLPQPFEPHLRDLAELSFPTKLSTYLAAGSPILLHSPDYGSIVPLFHQYNFGHWCRSLETDAIHSALLSLADADLRAIGLAIQDARKREFCSDVFLSRFEELTGPFKHQTAEVKAGDRSLHRTAEVI